MLRLVSMMLLLAALAIGATACGELSKEDYKKETDKISKNAEEGVNALSASSGEIPTEDELKEAADVLDEAADDLDALTPPADVKDAHNDMVDGVRKLATVLRDLGEGLGDSDDPTKMIETLTSLQGDIEEATEMVEKASAELAEAGFPAFASLSEGASGGGGDDAMEEDVMTDEEMDKALEGAEDAMEQLEDGDLDEVMEDAKDAADDNG